MNLIIFRHRQHLPSPLLVTAATTVKTLAFKMSLSMKLKYILTRKIILKKENLLEQIVQVFKSEIIQGKLSQIWITNDKDKEFIIINNENNNNNNNNENNYIQINVNNNLGKILLTKCICFIFKRCKDNPHYPCFLIILKKDDVNVRKIFFNYNKGICSPKLFKIMMRSFIIINQQQYIMFKNF